MATVREFAPFSLVFFSLITVLFAAAQIYPSLPRSQYPYPQYNPNPNQMPPSQQKYPPRPMSPKTAHNISITNSTYQIRGHDFIMGMPSPREKILLHTTVFKKPGMWSSVATKEITFPPRGSSLRVNITRIYATDKAKNGTGAFVKLRRGGVGQSNVTLLFRSQRYQPINFELDVYGYPK